MDGHDPLHHEQAGRVCVHIVCTARQPHRRGNGDHPDLLSRCKGNILHIVVLPINEILSAIRVMACHQTGNKPSLEPMMTRGLGYGPAMYMAMY